MKIFLIIFVFLLLSFIVYLSCASGNKSWNTFDWTPETLFGYCFGQVVFIGVLCGVIFEIWPKEK
jgi:hypothetical protein